MKKEQFFMLTRAVSSGDLGVIGDFYRQGLPLEAAGQESKRIALHYAALNGQVAVAKFLCERTAKVSIDHQDKEGNTPLNLSVLNGGELAARLNMIECLLDLRADPLIPNYSQKTPLMNMARIRDSKQAKMIPGAPERIEKIIGRMKDFAVELANRQNQSIIIAASGEIRFIRGSLPASTESPSRVSGMTGRYASFPKVDSMGGTTHSHPLESNDNPEAVRTLSGAF